MNCLAWCKERQVGESNPSLRQVSAASKLLYVAELPNLLLRTEFAKKDIKTSKLTFHSFQILLP